MAKASQLAVSAPVLAWARSTASLPVEEAAKRIGVSVSRLLEWETGDRSPSINQLRKMSEAYQRPLAALFMVEPPKFEQRFQLPDFRRESAQAEVEPRSLQKALFRARRQQQALREVADDLDLAEAELTFPLHLDPSGNEEDAGAALRGLLDLDSIKPGTVTRPDMFFREAVARVEEQNVTVIQVQNVAISDMRGFSLSEGACPLLAINGADWPRGKLFTLFHELAHLAFRTSGLCDLNEEGPDVEKKCNAIAAAALMPLAHFHRVAVDRVSILDSDYARAIGSSFGVSGEAAVLRMVTLNLARWSDYWRLKPDFEATYTAFKEDEKRTGNPEAPLYYQLKARDLGRGYIRTMLRAYANDLLSSRDIARLLDVKYDQIPNLASRLGEAL